MRLVMIGAAETILAEIDGGATQKQVAQTYRLAMESMRHGESPDWKRINAAIIKRWSLAGLVRVKKLAWSGKCFPPEAQPAEDRAAGAVVIGRFRSIAGEGGYLWWYQTDRGYPIAPTHWMALPNRPDPAPAKER